MLENQAKGNENMNRYNLPLSPGKQKSQETINLEKEVKKLQ